MWFGTERSWKMNAAHFSLGIHKYVWVKQYDVPIHVAVDVILVRIDAVTDRNRFGCVGVFSVRYPTFTCSVSVETIMRMSEIWLNNTYKYVRTGQTEVAFQFFTSAEMLLPREIALAVFVFSPASYRNVCELKYGVVFASMQRLFWLLSWWEFF